MQLEFFAVLNIFGSIVGSFWGPWDQLKKTRNLQNYKSHEAKFM